MQWVVVATSNTVAAVAIPASTRNFRSNTLGVVGLTGVAKVVLTGMKEVTPCEGDAIAVCVSNTGEAGIFWAAACIAMAKTKTVLTGRA